MNLDLIRLQYPDVIRLGGLWLGYRFQARVSSVVVAATTYQTACSPIVESVSTVIRDMNKRTYFVHFRLTMLNKALSLGRNLHSAHPGR